MSWFRSYLSNLEQLCKVNSVSSDIEAVKIDVPQGSCLSLRLFHVYVSDLLQVVHGSNVSMCTDDTSLCHQALNMTQLNGAIKIDLEHLDP